MVYIDPYETHVVNQAEKLVGNTRVDGADGNMRRSPISIAGFAHGKMMERCSQERPVNADMSRR